MLPHSRAIASGSWPSCGHPVGGRVRVRVGVRGWARAGVKKSEQRLERRNTGGTALAWRAGPKLTLS